MMSPPLHSPAQKCVAQTLIVQKEKKKKKKMETEAAFSPGLVPLPPLFPHAEELFVNGTKMTWETLTRWHVALPGWKNTGLFAEPPLAVQKIRAKRETLVILSTTPEQSAPTCKIQLNCLSLHRSPFGSRHSYLFHLMEALRPGIVFTGNGPAFF